MNTHIETAVKMSLEKLKQNLHCSMVVFLIKEPASTSPHIYSTVPISFRLQQHLLRFFSEYFRGRSFLDFGLRDGHLSDSLFGEFSTFGYRYTVSAPLSESFQEQRLSGVVWLGYSENRSPLDREVKEFGGLTQVFGRELIATYEMETLRSRVETAEGLRDENNQVIAHLSHDIRSPLGNIRTILNLIRLEGVTTETNEFLEVAIKNCDTLKDLVEDLLDYTKHRMGKLEARKTTLCMRTLVELVVESFRVTARLKGLDLQTEFSTDAGFNVHADKRQVSRILSNLIGNAIHYTSYGSVKVRVEAVGQKIKTVISDTGIGMGEDELKQLFTPFVRFHPQTTEGVGLGLALVKVLLDLNEGIVNVTSTPGVGTNFTLEFPEYSSGEQRVRISSDAQLMDSEFKRYSILVIDDDADFVSSFTKGLSLFGFKLFSAIKLSEAKGILTYQNIDFIISDAHMPEGGVKELLSFTRGKHVPTLILSGSELDHKKVSIVGASKILTKPPDMNLIIGWVKDEVEGRLKNVA